MPAEANKAVVRRYIERVINGGDLALIDELFTPEMAAKVRGFLSQGGDPFPDGREEIQELVAEGDTVVAHWIFRGTHGGAYFDIPATGKPIEMHGFAIYFFRDGRIADDLMVLDHLDALEQLGATILRPPAA